MAKKKKQTIGYKYFASGHFVLCHGPIDAITKISFQEKDAYQVEQGTNKTIYINKPSLFGGDEQQGGIQGNIELLFGHANQQKSSTLQRICAKISNAFGGLISAYRGVCSVVFDNVYIGTAPNMPDSKWRVKRIHTRHDGQVQWYDEKAEIRDQQDESIGVAPVKFDIDAVSTFYFDGSNIHPTPNLPIDPVPSHVNEMTFFYGLHEHVTLYDREAIIVQDAVGNFPRSSLRREMKITASAAGYYRIEGATRVYAKNVNVVDVGNCVFKSINIDLKKETGFDDPCDSYLINYKFEFKVEPGVIFGFDLFASGVTESSFRDRQMLGTTPFDAGIGLYCQIYKPTSVQSWTELSGDINPAHIIRECLTNPVWGIGVGESDIDDVSFKKAADKLYSEKMGMSIKWTDSTSINEFVDNIKEHINAQLYLDRVTNKWKLYLIRDDYDVADLISLNESNIRNLDFERRTLAECVNSVTVTYWDRERAKDSTVTVQDIARIAQQGGVISQSIDYKGFTNSDLASRVSLRDLKTLSSTLASVSFDVDESFSESWHEGMPFKLSDESYGLSEAVMRIRTIKRGDGINNTVYVEAIEDSFSSPMQSVVEYVPPITSGDSTAKNATAIAFEVLYIELVEQYGQDEVDAKLSNYPELGYVGMAAIRPNNPHVNASLYVDAGAGYDERTTLDFCPSASLKNDIGYMDSSFELENVAEFELLEANHRIQVNDEIMSFVGFDAVTSVITVKRGCFDTVPQKHDVGSKVFGWDNYSGIDDLEYLSGENVSLKALTLTGSDVLELNEATAHNLTLSSRAIRPYPPANVKVNGEYYPQDIETDLILTWVDRNRLQETGGTPLGFFDDGIVIESMTQTHLILSQLNENKIELATTNANVTGTSIYTMPISSMQANTRFVKITLKTLRDEYECLQPFEYTVELSQFFSSPYDLTVEFNND